MMRLFLLFVGLAILAPVLGCGRTMEQANLELEQDKLRLELMHAQRDELASLVKKQKEVGALEKKNEESLQELDKRRSEIQRLEQEVKQQQAALKSASAEEDARLKAAEDQLTAKEAELKAIEARNKDTLKRIAAENRAVYEKMTSLEARLARAESRTTAPSQEANSGKGKPVDRVAQARQQYLEALADATISIAAKVPIGTASENPQHARHELLQQLQKIGQTESEDQYQEAARQVAEQFALKVTNGMLTNPEIAAIRGFSYPRTEKDRQQSNFKSASAARTAHP